jgi:hypothetical protein
MITALEIKSLMNLKDVSDDVLNAVLPGARNRMREKLGLQAYRAYLSMVDGYHYEELQLAEIYYAVSLLPTSLLAIQMNGVLIDSSSWGQGQERYSSLDEIIKLQQVLCEQADRIVECYLKVDLERGRRVGAYVV